MDDRNKGYILTFEDRTDYLYARVVAETIDRPTAMAYLTEVAERVEAGGYERLILERDIPVMLSDTDLFFTTNDFLQMIRGVKAAFVNPHLKIENEMEFAMLIGTNRGGEFTLHRTFEDALRALNEV